MDNSRRFVATGPTRMYVLIHSPGIMLHKARNNNKILINLRLLRPHVSQQVTDRRYTDPQLQETIQNRLQSFVHCEYVKRK
jgi:hypothetical protein